MRLVLLLSWYLVNKRENKTSTVDWSSLSLSVNKLEASALHSPQIVKLEWLDMEAVQVWSTEVHLTESCQFLAAQSVH